MLQMFDSQLISMMIVLYTWQGVELELRHSNSAAGEDKLRPAHKLLPLKDVEGCQILKNSMSI